MKNDEQESHHYADALVGNEKIEKVKQVTITNLWVLIYRNTWYKASRGITYTQKEIQEVNMILSGQ